VFCYVSMIPLDLLKRRCEEALKHEKGVGTMRGGPYSKDSITGEDGMNSTCCTTPSL
jgi:hypothetical protein